MKPCKNYRCETKGRRLTESMFDKGEEYCRKCRSKYLYLQPSKYPKGTLRQRMEKHKGVKFAPVDTWSRT